MAAKKKKASGKRELISPNGDKRYVRRTKKGSFAKNQDDVGRSLSQDARKKAKRTVKSGHGDEGDQKPRKTAKKSTAKKSSTKKAAKKSSTKKAAKKSTAKKSTAKKSTAKKSAKKTSKRSSKR